MRTCITYLCDLLHDGAAFIFDRLVDEGRVLQEHAHIRFHSLVA